MNQINSKAISAILMRQVITPTREKQNKDSIELLITVGLFFAFGVVFGAILWIR